MFPQGIQNDEYQSAELFQFYTKEEDLKRADCPYSPSQVRTETTSSIHRLARSFLGFA
jgi:hypothetical protein